jgi:hypothetical protein
MGMGIRKESEKENGKGFGGVVPQKVERYEASKSIFQQ